MPAPIRGAFCAKSKMWSPDDPNFSKHVPSTFLIASWHELFYAFTPDSNQPRLHNVASLVDELADISKRCLSEPRLQNHVHKIQKELEEALREEDEILIRLPEYRSRAQYLVGESSPVAVCTGCQLLVEQRNQYEKRLIETASEAIDELPKKKRRAHKSIRRLATLAFQHGKEDNDVWDPLNKDPSCSTRDIFDEIVGLSNAGSSRYECILPVIGSPSEIQATLRSVGFSLFSKSKLPTPYLSEFTETHDRMMFVRVEIDATSIRNAVTTCRKRLGIATGLVSLYQNSQSLHVHPTALVRVAGSDVVFSQSEQAFRRLHPRSRASLDIREGQKLLKRQDVDKRLLGAIELLSLASSSPDSRIRLINLWSSIETLSGGHEGKTTLERVSSLLVPLVISRHVGRATRYLAIVTQQLASVLNRYDYGVAFTRSNEKFVSPEDMLTTLAAPKNAQAICDLLKFAQHPLLRYRIFRAWQTIYDPKELRSTLLQSKTRLEWHIARIYRARNLLVHEGEESPFLVPLLDNLQNYLSMAVQRLIHELKQHPTWDVRHAIEYWNGKMIHILTCLELSPQNLTIGDFIDGTSRENMWL